ncbi:BON domain-containing protein [Actinoplanes sp. NPDC026619]|uniref:BON domain-containing protein n=1 Tax=Actinoplanes sp. NPDC026619 TaxID=3155798 RepID=UPI003400C079
MIELIEHQGTALVCIRGEINARRAPSRVFRSSTTARPPGPGCAAAPASLCRAQGAESMSPFSGYPDDWQDPSRPRGSGDREDEEAEEWDSDAGLDTNSWIADRTVMTLRADSRIHGRYVQILVQNRVVILLGEVGSAGARVAASQAAWTVPGVYDVCNRLAVMGGPPADG